MCLPMQFDMEGEPLRPLWKTFRFWWILMTSMLAFGWLFAGIALAVRLPTKIVVVFEAWRWCIFFAGIMPVFWVSRLLIWLLVLLVEATLFKQWMALYFLAGTKVRRTCFCAGQIQQAGLPKSLHVAAHPCLHVGMQICGHAVFRTDASRVLGVLNS